MFGRRSFRDLAHDVPLSTKRIQRAGMTSILTNISSMSALQSLRTVSGGLHRAQSEASSGLRVATASDNVAYWSISTTMRSDNRAISAANDALGLGSAKTDTAYADMDAVIGVLGEFKAKLVTAREPATDNAKIQHELEQLKKQVVGISQSASFSGQNWLTTDLTDIKDDADVNTRKSVVSSFARQDDGKVSVNMIDVPMAQTSLFNTAGGGLLQKEIADTVTLPVTGSRDLGGLVSGAPSTHAHKGHTYFEFVAGSALSLSDSITFDVTVDSSTYSGGQLYTGISIDQALVNTVLGRADGSITSADELARVIDAALDLAGVPAGSGAGGYDTNFGVVSMNMVDIGSDETLSGHPGSSVVISNLVSTLAGNFAYGMDPSNIYQHMNLYASAGMAFTEGFQIDTTGSMSLDVTFAGQSAQSFTITKADVDAALGTTDGIVDTPSDMAALMNYALATSGLTFMAGANSLYIGVNAAIHPEQGGKSDFVVSNATSTGVTAVAAEVSLPISVNFDFLDIDVTGGADVDHYIGGLEIMIGKVVNGAASLGSLQRRIGMQSDFAGKLMDSIESGVGRLIDADMEEASSRLKALQTQEQLALQSLQIANAGSENILGLFN